MAKRTCKTDVAKIEMILKNNNLSKKQFCEELGHSTAWYSHITNLEKTITLTDVKAIRAIYGVDVELKEEIKKPASIALDADSADCMKRLDTLTGIVTQFSKDCHDADVDMIKRLDNLEDAMGDISISLRTIGNLLTQINEKCMKKDRPYVK